MLQLGECGKTTSLQSMALSSLWIAQITLDWVNQKQNLTWVSHQNEFRGWENFSLCLLTITRVAGCFNIQTLNIRQSISSTRHQCYTLQLKKSEYQLLMPLPTLTGINDRRDHWKCAYPDPGQQNRHIRSHQRGKSERSFWIIWTDDRQGMYLFWRFLLLFSSLFGD